MMLQKIDKQKRNFIGVRLVDAEYHALMRIGETECYNISEVVRQAIREMAKQRGLWPVTEKTDKHPAQAA